MRVLVVGPGSGTVRCSARLEALHRAFEVLCPEVEEPQLALAAGTQVLAKALEEFKPDVVVAGSRGGIYVSELINKHQWLGPTLLLSGMSILSCLARVNVREDGREEVIESGVRILLYHGTHDEMVPYCDVLKLSKAFASCYLIPGVGQSHSLSVLNSDPEILVNLVRKASALRDQGEHDLDQETRLAVERNLLLQHHMSASINQWKEASTTKSSDSWTD